MSTDEKLNAMVNVLARLDEKSVQEWNNTELREWIERKYQRRMQRESDLGGESGGA